MYILCLLHINAVIQGFKHKGNCLLLSCINFSACAMPPQHTSRHNSRRRNHQLFHLSCVQCIHTCLDKMHGVFFRHELVYHINVLNCTRDFMQFTTVLKFPTGNFNFTHCHHSPNCNVNDKVSSTQIIPLFTTSVCYSSLTKRYNVSLWYTCCMRAEPRF